MWREDVTQWLSEDAVTKCHRSLKPYFRLAWRFLWLRGYINFGVAPSFSQHYLPITPSSHTVVVIGAGLAGGSTCVMCVLDTTLTTHNAVMQGWRPHVS